MKMEQSNILNDLNIILENELNIKGFILPFLFKASDINSFSINLVDETFELKGENKYLNDTFFLKDKILKYVNMKKIEFSDESINESQMDISHFKYIEEKRTYVLKDVDSLYLFFKKIGMNEQDYYEMGTHVQSNITSIRDEILTIIHMEMENGSKKEHLSSGFMQVQAIMEFSSSMIFYENQGKSGDMWSFRETLLRKAYLGRKYEYDRIVRERYKAEAKR